MNSSQPPLEKSLEDIAIQIIKDNEPLLKALASDNKEELRAADRQNNSLNFHLPNSSV